MVIKCDHQRLGAVTDKRIKGLNKAYTALVVMTLILVGRDSGPSVTNG